MLKMTYEKAFGQEVARFTVPELPEDFQAIVDALPQKAQYCFKYGWKQSLGDSYAGAKTVAEFESALTKKFTAIVTDTVREAGEGAARVKRSPLDQEIFRLAGIKIDEAIRGQSSKVSKENRLILIADYTERFLDDLTLTAQDNLDKQADIPAVEADVMAELFAKIKA